MHQVFTKINVYMNMISQYLAWNGLYHLDAFYVAKKNQNSNFLVRWQYIKFLLCSSPLISAIDRSHNINRTNQITDWMWKTIMDPQTIVGRKRPVYRESQIGQRRNSCASHRYLWTYPEDVSTRKAVVEIVSRRKSKETTGTS